jgi:hypothetical protein
VTGGTKWKSINKYEGKSLNNRNFILKCMQKYAQWRILFRDTKWLLSSMPYRGRDDQAVPACATARTTWPLHCQLAPGNSKEALFSFLWSEGVKPEIYRRMKVQYGDSYLSQGRLNEWVVIFQNGRQKVCRWQWSNGGGTKLVKGHAKKLFSRRHPQGCGPSVLRSRETMSKNKTQTISISTLVKTLL